MRIVGIMDDGGLADIPLCCFCNGRHNGSQRESVSNGNQR